MNQYDDISTLKLGECEKKIKKHYNLSENEPLIIFKIDLHEEGLLIPIVNYEIYNFKTKEQIDLNICNDTTIKIVLPANIDENNEFKYNPNSDYYNDICYTYSTENKTDITLADRKTEYIINNMSLCEVNCEIDKIENKKVECDCQIKIKLPLISEIVVNKDKLLKSFVDIKNSTNFKILKCYYVVFTKEGLKTNIGSYILLFIILVNIICLIIFIIKENKLLWLTIDKIIYKKEKKNNANDNNINKKEINKNKNKKENKESSKEIKKKQNEKRNKEKTTKKTSIINNNNIKIIINNNLDKNKNKKEKKNENKNKNNPPKIKKFQTKKYKKSINLMITNGDNKFGMSSSRIGIKNNTLNIDNKNNNQKDKIKINKEKDIVKKKNKYKYI